MQFDIAQQMKACEGIEKIEQRNDTGKVSNIFLININYIQRQKFDSGTYEKNRQEKGKQ